MKTVFLTDDATTGIIVEKREDGYYRLVSKDGKPTRVATEPMDTEGWRELSHGEVAKWACEAMFDKVTEDGKEILGVGVTLYVGTLADEDGDVVIEGDFKNRMGLSRPDEHPLARMLAGMVQGH